MFDINQHISSLLDVELFARYLYDVTRIAFHPDDSFEGYVSMNSNKQSFTPDEAHTLNQRMKESYQVCEKENVDIYDFMMQFSPIHALMSNTL